MVVAERHQRVMEENHQHVEDLKQEADKLEQQWQQRKVCEMEEWKEKTQKKIQHWQHHLEHKKEAWYRCNAAWAYWPGPPIANN
jgi:ElaB/YqjD/DUF883 family membrane-anchored ribosome-binding protein